MKKLFLILMLLLTSCSSINVDSAFQNFQPTQTFSPTNTIQPTKTHTSTLTPTPTLTPTLTITPTPTVEKIILDINSINKNIEDYLSGELDYRGPNNYFMFVDSQNHLLEIGYSNVEESQFEQIKYIYIYTVAVLLGFFDNGNQQYLVLGSEKNNQRVVWLLSLGLMDSNLYPQLNKIMVHYLGTNPNPSLNKIISSRGLVIPEELSIILNSIIGRPIQVMFEVNYENVDSSKFSSKLNEYEILHIIQNTSYDFSVLSNWLDRKGSITELQMEPYVINKLDSSFLSKEIFAPRSSNLFLPLNKDITYGPNTKNIPWMQTLTPPTSPPPQTP